MHAEDAAKQEPESDSPGLSASAASPALTNVSKTSNGTATTTPTTTTNANGTVKPAFPPPKTDKPRPHVCQTCTRSFARLEHLKRHERSHTKEKPFECPECTRCFARRDLLLRHQQKLHMTNTTTRPRTGRRESVAGGNGNGRVRKNSVANINVNGINGAASNQIRPRANTISHIDLSSLGLMDGHAQMDRMNALGLGMNGAGMMGMHPGLGHFDYRGMSTAMGQHGNLHGLPKLDTAHANHMDMTNSLRTAPPQASFGGFDIDQLFTPHTTINPAALHFGSAGQISSTNIPFGLEAGTNQQVPIDDDFGWMRNWGMNMAGNDHENAIEESSPSRMSSGDSPGDFSESMTNSQAAIPIQNNFQWHPQDLSLQQTLSHSSTGPFQLDGLCNGLPSLDQQNGTLSPSSLHDPTPTGDTYFHQAMMQHNNGALQRHPSQADIMQNQGANFFGAPVSNIDSDSPGMSSPSMTSSTSARQSSMTSMSTDSITESTRQALLNSLSQPSLLVGHNQRKYSQPTVSSPLSGGAGARNATPEGVTLPSRADLQRYIEAFMQYAHPHLPITHIATVTFNPVDLVAPQKGSPAASSSPFVTANGPQCLILGMAAIGALYEYDHPASKNLFEAAKKMISLYLEDRRKADMASAINREASHSTTPLWLVQAMLLNVIYGHHCGDRLAAEISSNHIAALVSLARSADLQTLDEPRSANVDTAMGNGDNSDLHATWIKWKTAEEQKRCFFGIFILSSLLTTAYNQTPSIMNSEILLDLPCEEELYEAPSAEEWHARGGLARVEENSLSFADALSSLLTANQRSSTFDNGNFGASGSNLPASEIKPSTFGCLVLINALHNYIWETRSRHRGREWTMQETESMIANIEPALNAWMAAWKANERHTLERPNPFGLGPLAADSIPLLDLAYVRLYVNLGRTAEAFWARDFNKMAEELIAFNAFEESSSNDVKTPDTRKSPDTRTLAQRRMSSAIPNDQAASTRRERHLRKAAAYAADALTVACRFNLTYSDAHAHELPIQAAICFLDCAQVLAEWVTTVQERTGKYLGVLGRDAVDYTDVPAVMLLAPEDMEMLHKLEQIYTSMKEKHAHQEMNLMAMNPNNFSTNMHHNVNLDRCGYGSKIMRVTAMMLEKAVIWPITHVMAAALEVQAGHMDRRSLQCTGELSETTT
ncbi:hypothetical protein CKM354_000926900 [Cercospora kikuchii]|uniref:C2H2-type domain-containing protein n=1 Tax=Cercospora kikuchii TaxID=84275 RepID=A0A9P3CT15_9PEZI|nr:uncharacterized protein CKM354_000926900 [Cercospora kikuchii]GIZ46130.1 hypothetical protein CKM354_000926900 [Cercospora kikuchii]